MKSDKVGFIGVTLFNRTALMSPPLSLAQSAYLIPIPRRSLWSWVHDNLDGYTVEHDGLCITVPYIPVSFYRALMWVLPIGFLRSELRGSEW